MSLSNEICDQASTWDLDTMHNIRDHVYDEYRGYLRSPDGHEWHITFEDPKYETLFKLKHPFVSPIQQDL